MNNQQPTPITLAIYRDVRVGMVIVTVMVFVAIVIEQLSATCWHNQRPSHSPYTVTCASAW